MSKVNFLRLSLAVMTFCGSADIFAQNANAIPGLSQAPTPPADASSFVAHEPYTLPWERIAESNILWKKRVWREIDTREKDNLPLAGDGHTPASRNLTGILLGGLTSGQIKAYSAADDRFTTILTKEELATMVTSKSSGLNPAKVYKYRIKEDWLFLKKENKMVVRILGIAPVVNSTTDDGTAYEKELFWLYYPDIREFLAQYKVYEPNSSASRNWDEYFESRSFKSKIEKVSDPRNGH